MSILRDIAALLLFFFGVISVIGFFYWLYEQTIGRLIKTRDFKFYLFEDLKEIFELTYEVLKE